MWAQIRHRGKALKCQVEKDNRGLVAIFSDFHQAPSAGQSIVFYQKNKLLGGGIIS